MSVTIRQIHIENFRSIQRLTIPADKLSVLVGKNDSGKSNILRALNLFFNEVTNAGKSFDFEDDYNLFVPERAKTAKEVVVRLELNIPSSYYSTNGEIIVWEKRWRSGGLHVNHYWGYRLSTNRRGREVRTQVDIPERSNAHGLLRQIEFEYVPAIKDSGYFDDLRGRIYSIIAEVAARTFRTSSTAFEDSIGEHLADLTTGIGHSLGIETRLALPRDLSHIFQRLDFLSGAKGISLDHRGDGIKTRHIPLILKFMAEKKRSLQVRGAAPYSYIWAYEEPENNLEFSSAVELAVQLADFASRGVAQILLTTHSPVFYDLGDTCPEGVACAHVYRDTDDEGTSVSESGCAVDEKMGTMALLAPRVKQLVLNVREQVEARHSAEVLARQNRPKIFVEGESDKIVLGRCATVFHAARAGFVDIETKREGAGHSYVIDMLNGWRCQHKHHQDGPRAAGILDVDAIKTKNEWNAGVGNTASAKCFCYPKPDHAIAALRAGFRLPVTLEVLYSLDVWQWAEARGMLEDRLLADTYPAVMVEEILKGGAGNVEVDEAYRMYVTRRFRAGTKVDVANHVARLAEARVRAEFDRLGALLGEVFDYLGVAEP
ncbi:ATP-dependent nuclease [Allosphingosinicella indica]|uniref:Predicted ATP-dependent endonuclease of the OLD family, contains P-loop ATPase and TOPRIM domains n=1 Tax=Allosphingosinicella indica TaxID=941907 RepID=A0A1X7FZY7_9SPHN|nr:AAA family ATPase [Allosphingosinicella indica]SMF61173.1 Predicted ATP-dependent endonuclease of the OLD family, contains P-loop ATPase and TOPRIM domains [Allosphingosinicella indica]